MKSSKRVHKSDWKDDGIPFYRAREIVKLSEYGEMQNELFISQDLFNEFTEKTGYPKSGDIVISAVGTLGKCYLVQENDLFYFKDASVLWFKKIKPINSRFIIYLFKSEKVLKQVLKGSMGATVGTLTITRAKRIEIPVPPLPEQERIVAILDETFEKIDRAQANIEKNIANAEELFQSKLDEVFSQTGEGWEEKKLGDVCDNLRSLQGSNNKEKQEERSFPYFGASGIVDYVDDYLFNEKLLLVSEDGANLLMRTYPIAFSVNGKIWVNNHAHVLRFKNEEYQKFFIEYYLNSIKLDPFVSGMAQPKLNQKKLNSIPVPHPDISSVVEINNLLDNLKKQLNNLTNSYSTKSKALEELKKSILVKAFSGELVKIKVKI